MENRELEMMLQKLMNLVAKTFNLSTMDAVAVMANSSIVNKFFNSPAEQLSMEDASQALIMELKKSHTVVS